MVFEDFYIIIMVVAPALLLSLPVIMIILSKIRNQKNFTEYDENLEDENYGFDK